MLHFNSLHFVILIEIDTQEKKMQKKIANYIKRKEFSLSRSNALLPLLSAVSIQNDKFPTFSFNFFRCKQNLFERIFMLRRMLSYEIKKCWIVDGWKEMLWGERCIRRYMKCELVWKWNFVFQNRKKYWEKKERKLSWWLTAFV